MIVASASQRRKLISVNIVSAILCLLVFFSFFIADWRAQIEQLWLPLAIAVFSYLYLCKVCFRESGRCLISTIVLWAILLRIVALVGAYNNPESNLSADLNRYLWEGKVVAAGYNPYQLPPDSAQLSKLRQENHELWLKVDHKAIPALYPALVLRIFAWIEGSESAYRAMLLISEALVLWLLLATLRLRELALGRVAIYAFCPLTILEIGVGAHLDALMLPGIVAGLLGVSFLEKSSYRLKPNLAGKGLSISSKVGCIWILSFLAIVAAALIKQTALLVLVIVLFLGFFRKRSLGRSYYIAPIIGVLFCFYFYYPFISQGNFLGSLGLFSNSWRFNGHLFYLFENLFASFAINEPALIVKLFFGLFMILVLYMGKDLDALSLSTLMLFLVFLLSPVRYPWYALAVMVLLPSICSGRLISVAVASCLLSMLSYEVWRHPQNWETTKTSGFIQYFPVVLFVLFSLGEKLLDLVKAEHKAGLKKN